MRRYTATILPILLLFLSCKQNAASDADVEPINSSTISFQVKHAGALRNMMHKGFIGSEMKLKELVSTPHSYALGALENLKGEILIWDGKPFISFEDSGSVSVSHNWEHNATLLVYSSVENWNEYPLPEIKSGEALETKIEEAARNAGIDTEKPFPFQLIGRAGSIDWHVINWPEGDKDHSHEKHVSSGPHGTLENPDLKILGFYSKHHHAIFTHHTTNMHMHFISQDSLLAGHVDNLVPGAGMKLMLPGE